ncbi:uncharacterized CRM domain-containing protein At3g25440, chloroplastic-like isoform X1 [Panicum virgatum]|uniref:CRM domain-containing protein n=2 Tax=Panicum virgatum TaxID=38727 RepID=A0A8T0QJN2_PANVG|nr:uncharacterized CRM domain-containing protein At3g25440, chloroplastic-like isoform X1 [Panicum virgatum]KAG2573019.1 hypothetical protein PVAP13_7KG220300 [Panicum virgatum]
MASRLFLLRRATSALRRQAPRSRSFRPSSDGGSLASSRGTLELLAPPPSSSPSYNFHKVFNRDVGFFCWLQSYNLQAYHCINTSRSVSSEYQAMEQPQQNPGAAVSVDDSAEPKPKRKKLKGKRAVTRFLKSLRWKKKKEIQRMTAEEKFLYKLKLARKKEERLVTALKKIEPEDPSEPTHDPEVLTPEEHFYFLKMGQKCKNYVPVGRRGIYQGVILNMHLHWKKHQTLQVIVKTFTPDEVKEIATELARLSGGIVLDIQDGNTIIMYRGKNYVQPPPEIMSPKVTLPRKKALDKSKYKEKLRAVRRYIPRLEQELEDLHAQMKLAGEHKGGVGKYVASVSQNANSMTAREESSISVRNKTVSDLLSESAEGSKRLEDESSEVEDVSASESMSFSESEDLSDIFETESEEQEEDSKERPLYLDRLDKFPSENNDNEQDDFEEHLRKIASLSDKSDSPSKELKVSELDEIDKIFLRASSLLKKR